MGAYHADLSKKLEQFETFRIVTIAPTTGWHPPVKGIDRGNDLQGLESFLPGANCKLKTVTSENERERLQIKHDYEIGRERKINRDQKTGRGNKIRHNQKEVGKLVATPKK